MKVSSIKPVELDEDQLNYIIKETTISIKQYSK